MSLNDTTAVYSVEAGSRPAESAVAFGCCRDRRHRAGAPPIETSRWSVPPWYWPSILTIVLRPVAARASRIAVCVASTPDCVNRIMSIEPG